MRRYPILTALFIFTILAGPVSAQQPDSFEITQERTQAELDASKLAAVLGLKPGMTVADIGTGGGAMAVVLAKWLGSGRVYATDITERALQTTRESAKNEGLTNITVLEGGADRTNLPSEGCDGLFMRHVYHHITAVVAFNKSLVAALKPGGVVDELTAAGLTHTQTIESWPPGDKQASYFLVRFRK